MTRQAEKSNFKSSSCRRWVGSSMSQWGKQTTKLWIKMLKQVTQETENKEDGWQVLETLSPNRPRWWIGRSTFCPGQHKNYPEALLLCLHGDVKINQGTFEKKRTQFSQRRHKVKKKEKEKKVSMHRSLEIKGVQLFYIQFTWFPINIKS